MLFADIIGGLYTPEESAAIEGVSWEPLDPAAELVDPIAGRVMNDEPADVDDLAEGVDT